MIKQFSNDVLHPYGMEKKALLHFIQLRLCSLVLGCAYSCEGKVAHNKAIIEHQCDLQCAYVLGMVSMSQHMRYQCAYTHKRNLGIVCICVLHWNAHSRCAFHSYDCTIGDVARCRNPIIISYCRFNASAVCAIGMEKRACLICRSNARGGRGPPPLNQSPVVRVIHIEC